MNEVNVENRNDVPEIVRIVGALAASSNFTVALKDNKSHVVITMANDCTIDVTLSDDVVAVAVNNDFYDWETSAIMTIYRHGPVLRWHERLVACSPTKHFENLSTPIRAL